VELQQFKKWRAKGTPKAVLDRVAVGETAAMEIPLEKVGVRCWNCRADRLVQ
jgi:hypothetical protein